MLSYLALEPNMRHLNYIFSPLYQISPEIASGKSLPIWNACSYLGIKLGRSPNHSISVYLVLNIVTGIDYAIFHCYFDNYFETDWLSSDATNNASNCQSLESFRKIICPSRTFTDTLYYIWQESTGTVTNNKKLINIQNTICSRRPTTQQRFTKK